MITQEQYQEALKVVLEYKEQLLQEANYIKSISLSGTTKIVNWDISTRLRNCIFALLQSRGIDYRTARIFDLTVFSEKDFRRVRSMGNATMTELVQSLHDVNLKLKSENGN